MAVQGRVAAAGLDEALPLYEIDADLLEELKKKHKSTTVRVINLIKTIQKTVDDDKGGEPYLVDIGERAERIRKLFESRQEGTKEALAELEALIKEIDEARNAQADKKMDIRAFTIFWILKEAGLSRHDELSRELSAEFDSHSNWHCNAEENRQLKSALYKRLIQIPLKDKVIEVGGRLFNVMDELKRRDGAQA